ncbi:DNA polymerase III subunit beta [Williamsoniiplasma lucivorax]|uniref:Beta sliding clamp n=1 Tax=Williamsoniiplasma lucivorax TaxID=209274 RepID=A0A2S5RF06_9MOLU|nr:DNA polymerase III subunit beta [Williamsoniiplasma lucivorax]PPE05891.1 DNA polymerase III subunit beta [Williamsoniiplasma lucivorax]
MEFIINRNSFFEELSKATKIIDYKTINPILTGVLIELTENKLVLISTNGILSLKTILNNENADLEVKQTGRILIKAKHILEILKRLDDDLITISVVENNEIKIKTTKTEFNLGILDADDYPLIGFREKGIELDLDSKEIKKAISQTIISINEWNKKITLTGMNFKTKDNHLLISTTDMFRISQKKIPLETNRIENINLTIPHVSIVDLSKIIEHTKKFKILINEAQVTFILDNTIFQSNLIDGQFPNVEGVFPQEFTTTITVNSKTILKTLNRADIPTDDNLSPVINMQIQQNKILFKSLITEVGTFEEEFNNFTCEKFEELNINFNTKFLIEAIRSFDDEMIELNFINNVKPVVINKKGSEELKQVVLPTYITN